MTPKKMFLVDLTDTQSNRIMKEGLIMAGGPTEAMRKFHKSLGEYNKQINYLENRPDHEGKYSRYVFGASSHPLTVQSAIERLRKK